MPLGKYYCDYCDKQFQDTPSARKRHLQGIQHQRARALWFDSFKGPHGGSRGPLFQPEESLPKGVCHHFIRTGTCKYGDACQYLHPKQDLAMNLAPAVSGFSFLHAVQSQGILSHQLAGDKPLPGNVVSHMGVSWGNLPPSLRPPPEGGYPPLPFVDWG